MSLLPLVAERLLRAAQFIVSTYVKQMSLTASRLVGE
jgi:hypothetical protein